MTRTTSARLFAQRSVDNLFRRGFWYLLPVVVLAVVGVSVARGLPTRYVADAGLSASTNPLVDRTLIRGAAIADWETPAAGTARLINEQLQTDAFIDEVAERAGLDGPIDSGVIGYDIVRDNLGARTSGSTHLRLVARWDDPVTAQLLVASTIDAYRAHLEEIVSSDSTAAIEFWSARRTEAEQRVQEAETTYETYLGSLGPVPEDGERTADEQLTIRRLDAELARATEAVNEARSAIDTAQLSLVQAQSDAGRQLLVIDAPTVPAGPESDALRTLLPVVMFIAIGIMLSAIAVVVTTVLDRAVRHEAHLAALTGAPTTVTISRHSPARWERLTAPLLRRLGTRGPAADRTEGSLADGPGEEEPEPTVDTLDAPGADDLAVEADEREPQGTSRR